jgi:23S rRNA (uracil1939-C5)-methyltransferase
VSEPAIDVRIEKLVYGGEGLGHVEGQALLVPFVAPSELVTVEPMKREARLLRARLLNVVEASPDRTEPGCPYFGRCGGCQYQHLQYEAQVREKRAILREVLQRVGKLDSPEPAALTSPPWNYRNRTRFRFEKSDGVFRLGYFMMASHRLLPIEKCPISSPRINTLITELYELGKRPDFAEGQGEIEVFVNHEDSELLLTVTSEQRWPETLVSAAREIIPGMPSLGTRRPQPAPQKRAGRSPQRPSSGRFEPDLHVFGKGHILYRAAGADYRVSHGSFFQTNRFLVEQMAATATEGLEGEIVLELFSGVGYFALPLARRFAHVVAVESNRSAVKDLDSNRARVKAANIEVIQAGAEEFLHGPTRSEPGGRARGHQPARSRQPFRPDVVLLDPPRAGLGKESTEKLASLGARSIVYVSCDPATLARDLAVLAARGYAIESLTLLDLFPQTFHIESVVRLAR